ncbi:MAG TPA: DUF1579 domain-containing protein [Tepidisphaeraceae bacterium]
MHNKPEKQHEWLRKFVGEWTSQTECTMTPGGPPETFGGTDSVRAVGDLWVVGEGRGRTPGGDAATMLLTLGYDPQQGRFVGTWVGSMMSYLWVYNGVLDEAGRVLRLGCQGPSMSEPGKLTAYQDVFEFHSDDHRTLTALTRGDDGEWTQIMMTHYRRVKES